MRRSMRLVPLAIAIATAAVLAAPPTHVRRDVDGWFKGCCSRVIGDNLVVEGAITGGVAGQVICTFQRVPLYPGPAEMWIGSGVVELANGPVSTRDIILLTPSHEPRVLVWTGRHTVLDSACPPITGGWMMSSGLFDRSTMTVVYEYAGEMVEACPPPAPPVSPKDNIATPD